MNQARSVEDWIAESKALEDRGEIPEALQAARIALDLAQGRSDSHGMAAASVQQAYLEFRLGHYQKARNIAQDSLALSGPLDPARADAYLILGNVSAETDSLAAAEIWYLEAADLSRTIGYAHVRCRSQHNLAMGVYIPRGKFDLAMASGEEAYRLAAQTWSNYLPYPLTTLTWIYQITGHTSLARQTLEMLGKAYLPGSLHEGYYHFLAGQIALDEDNPPETSAIGHFLRGRSIAEAIGEPGLNVQVRLGLSRCYRRLAAVSSARVWAEDALEIARRAGYAHMQGLACIELGRAAWMDKHNQAAEELFHQAIEILEPIQAEYDLARVYLELAGLLLEQHSPGVRAAWKEACRRILVGGYLFLIDRRVQRVYPLLAEFVNDRQADLRLASAQLLERLSQVPPPPLRIVTLGKFEVTQGSRRIPARLLGQRNAGELLALLLFSPQHCLSVEQVSEALWPDKELGATQHLLHHTTSALRQALEPNLPARLPSRYVQVEAGQVALNLPPGSWVDFDAFAKHCKGGEWEAALGLYGGDLLPPYLYANWTTLLRQKVVFWLLAALANQSQKRLDENNYVEALELCQRLLALEPWHECGVAIGMRACLGLGDPAGALRLYRSLERSLCSELGVQPQDDLRALAEEIFRKTV
ncbi:MAG: BTAD domain-containing putative transcriptional regulator [Anaerolineaceae bacterium]|nr:BTAD domain-containing putative transcriptional regulator [Anaerolineaceae bacterium]